MLTQVGLIEIAHKRLVFPHAFIRAADRIVPQPKPFPAKPPKSIKRAIVDDEEASE